MSVDVTPDRTGTAPSPTMVREPTAGGVVVGIDGSGGSRAALEYACDEASLRGLHVAVVTAWTGPDAWVSPFSAVPSAYDMQANARKLAAEEIRTVLAGRAARGASTPTVELSAVSGPAAVVLERLSAHAAMLIVGHRGRGAVASTLIGSVGLSTVVHARCTVVVVRSPEESGNVPA